MAKIALYEDNNWPLGSKAEDIANKLGTHFKSIGFPHVQVKHNLDRADGERCSSVIASTHKNAYGSPISTPGHKEASGITLNLYHYHKDQGGSGKIIPEMYEINSHEKGNGSKLVKGAVDALTPHKDHLSPITVHHDWTSGFWHTMSQRYNSVPWATSRLNKPK